MTAVKNAPFVEKLPFKMSKAALGLILSTLFLAGLLAFSTLQNINRERAMMERFLKQNGETIINAIEAAMRTSMLHHMGESSALHTLLYESSRVNDIVFIVITDKDGTVISQTENAPPADNFSSDRERLTGPGAAVTFLEEQSGIFTITKQLTLSPVMRRKGMRAGTAIDKHMMHPFTDVIISLGLFTHEFDTARRQDVQHAVFMGAVLFLVGSAGLYLIFLYQGMRVAKSTLANMKIYTDNVIESIPVGLVTLDSRDRVVSCNRKMEELMDRSFQEIQGRTVHDAFPDCQLNVEEICSSILDYSTECVTGDGKNIPVKIGGSLLVNSEGESIGTVLVIRDMSLIRDMEQQLERSRRMAALGTMAAGIAHEIRNPLGTLKGFAHFFGNQPDTSKEGQNYAKLMESEIDRLNRNISALLQFARPRNPHIVRVSMEDLIGKTAALMEGDISEKDLNFQYRCKPEVYLHTDPDMLTQVLLNLLKNSIAATPEGGDVVLAVSSDSAQIRITVSDNGKGMTQQESEKMFDPFFTTRKGGTGLGLAISHQLIEQLGGSFEVVTAPDAGTAVTVVLPFVQEA